MDDRIKRILAQLTPRGRLAVAAIGIGLALLLVTMVWPARASPVGGDEEQRLAATLQRIKGAGAVQVMITYETQAVSAFSQSVEKGQVKGVLVVASGAWDLAVRERLAQSVATLMQVPISQVQVVTME